MSSKIISSCIIKKIFLFLVMISFVRESKSQDVITIKSDSFPLAIGKRLEIFIDDSEKNNLNTILSVDSFKKVDRDVPIFLEPNKNIWGRVRIRNASKKDSFLIELRYSNISDISFYKLDSNKLVLVNHTGNAHPFDTRTDEKTNFNFPLKIPVGEEQTFYFEINTLHPLELPIVITDLKEQNESYFFQNLIAGVYCGIIGSILLYNLFLFFFTRDRSYFLYVLYLFFLGFAQFTLSGWSFKFLWPSIPAWNEYAVIWTSGLAGLTGVAFGKHFLNTKEYSPIGDKVLTALILLYLFSIISILFDAPYISYLILNSNGILGGVTLLIIAIIIVKKGYRPAYFYLLAWSFFLLGLVIFVFKNLGIIPTNNFTHYVLYYGSTIEVILLSIALADKINLFRKEKEASQAEALRISQENEQLIKQQNVVLEEKVHERTIDLENANQKLSKTLSDLQEAQLQLVEAEKMASLGQLTAGIAHEINNPINFVKSNIKPLQLDLKDLLEIIDNYDELHNSKGNHLDQKLAEISKLKEELDIDFLKTEINNLIKGIEEGAERTAEIVRSLRTFSRLDEGELKEANVHDGLNSTLVLLKNSIPHHIKIIKNYYADGEIECYAGKLNQVFMNIINNGVQAILAKKNQEETESITITTQDIDDNIEISIKDSGIGMTEEVKQKIYDPFFTTKDVGEGTGLGMSIVFKIIEKHSGKIKINSSPGNGAEFIITLPRMQSAVLS